MKGHPSQATWSSLPSLTISVALHVIQEVGCGCSSPQPARLFRKMIPEMNGYGHSSFNLPVLCPGNPPTSQGFYYPSCPQTAYRCPFQAPLLGSVDQLARPDPLTLPPSLGTVRVTFSFCFQYPRHCWISMDDNFGMKTGKHLFIQRIKSEKSKPLETRLQGTYEPVQLAKLGEDSVISMREQC